MLREWAAEKWSKGGQKNDVETNGVTSEGRCCHLHDIPTQLCRKFSEFFRLDGVKNWRMGHQGDFFALTWFGLNLRQKVLKHICCRKGMIHRDES